MQLFIKNKSRNAIPPQNIQIIIPPSILYNAEIWLWLSIL